MPYCDISLEDKERTIQIVYNEPKSATDFINWEFSQLRSVKVVSKDGQEQVVTDEGFLIKKIRDRIDSKRKPGESINTEAAGYRDNVRGTKVKKT